MKMKIWTSWHLTLWQRKKRIACFCRGAAPRRGFFEEENMKKIKSSERGPLFFHFKDVSLALVEKKGKFFNKWGADFWFSGELSQWWEEVTAPLLLAGFPRKPNITISFCLIATVRQWYDLSSFSFCDFSIPEIPILQFEANLYFIHLFACRYKINKIKLSYIDLEKE